MSVLRYLIFISSLVLRDSRCVLKTRAHLIRRAREGQCGQKETLSCHTVRQRSFGSATTLSKATRFTIMPTLRRAAATKLRQKKERTLTRVRPGLGVGQSLRALQALDDSNPEWSSRHYAPVIVSREGMRMKALLVSLGLIGMLSGCISSSNPPPPAKTTVVVPASNGTTVVCQDGTKPPCN